MKRLPLWPSSASRWLICPGQPRIAAIAMDNPREENPYADEGKAAHGYLEWCLTGGEGEAPCGVPEDQRAELTEIAEIIRFQADITGKRLSSEMALTLTFDTGRDDPATHEMHLYADIVLEDDASVTILDYKHGAGIQVRVVDNPQLLLYLLAAREQFPGRRFFSMGVIQPRGQGEGWATVTVTTEQLDAFMDRVSAAVKAAYAKEVDYVPGNCQFCPGTQNPICPAHLSTMINAVIEEPDMQSWWLLDHLEGIKKVASGVDKAADVWLRSGKRIEGWTLESRPGRRTWYAPEEVPGVLAELLGGDESKYQTTKTVPITLTEATKIAKRRKVDIDGLIHQPMTTKRIRTEDRAENEETKMEAIE